MRSTLALLAFIVLFIGCDTSHLDEPTTLTNTDWRQATLDGSPASSTRILDFRTNELSANTECGKFTADYNVDGDEITIELIFFGMNCGGYSPTDVLDFVKALESVDRFSIENDRLILSQDGNERITFVAHS